MKIIILLSMIIIPSILVTQVFAQDYDTLKLYPIDDTFVAVNLADPQDTEGLAQLQRGDNEFLQIMSSINTTSQQEVVLSLVLLKFDLSDFDLENIQNANLKLKQADLRIQSLTNGIDISIIDNNNWDESTVTFSNKPDHSPDSIATIPISKVQDWYEVDITEAIKTHTNSKISLALSLSTGQISEINNIIFHSKDSPDEESKPYLEIKYAVPTGFSLGDSDDSIFVIGGLIAAGFAGVAIYALKKNKAISKEPPREQKKSMPKKQCKNCGTTISAHFKFCPSCGAEP